jgi:hypothetical protein
MSNDAYNYADNIVRELRGETRERILERLREALEDLYVATCAPVDRRALNTSHETRPGPR